jgi:histidine triad (HIT) family protein
MKECVFCKISNREIPSNIAYEDAEVIAFEDNNPQAPVHLVIVPKKHIERISDVSENDAALAGKLLVTAKRLAREKQIETSGYRIVINCNRDAGQVVFHLHVHLLGGRTFGWPPG